MHAKILDTLYADRAKIKNEAREADERLKNYSNELKRVKALIEEYRDANRRIAEIDKELAPINEKLERLRAVYTDNWPEVASLKQKADMLKEGREDLLARAGRLKTYEGEKSKLESKIEVETATYRELQRDIGSLDEQLGEAVKAMTGEKVDVAENPRAGTVQESQKSAYGYVINPPSINYLPDLGQQLIFGLFAGTAAWLLIGLIAGKR
jgi:capsule polysaccharide export protein KpsE/RkpR